MIRSLVPMAHVRSVPESIAFYEKLGFELGNTFVPSGQTEPTWAWLKSDGAHFMVAKASHPVAAEEQAVLFYVYCDDVPETRAALGAAGIPVGPIEHPFYAPRGEFPRQRPGRVRSVLHPRGMSRGQKRPRRPRKIIAYLATSADGFIARPDGGVEWLDRPRPAGNYGMGKFFQSIDTILLGRKTYEVALGLTGGKGIGSGKRVKNYVFSRRPPKSHTPDVEFVREPIRAFARRLRAAPGKDVWLMGGGGLIGSFLDAGEIDELVIHVIPTIIGKGIPLIAPRHRLVPLRLLSARRFSDGVVRLHYAVGGRWKRRAV